MTETIKTPVRAAARASDGECERLQKLVAELVEKNQALRFKVAMLERKARRAQAALDEASVVYRFLVP